MKSNYGTHLTQMRWRRVVGAGLSLMVAAGTAWAANDFDTPNPRGQTNRDGSNTYNAIWLGHNDLQGRTTYQTTVHTQGRRVIAYAGHFAGTMLNPMTHVVEENGTSIVDVTDPRHPKYLKHLIAQRAQYVVTRQQHEKVAERPESDHALLGRRRQCPLKEPFHENHDAKRIG